MRWTSRDVERVLALIEEGYTPTQVQDITGVDRRQISTWVQRAKLMYVPGKADTRDRVIRRLRGELGMTYTAVSAVLAEYHGIKLCPESVRRRSRELGLPFDERKSREASAKWSHART
jgi:transposase